MSREEVGSCISAADRAKLNLQVRAVQVQGFGQDGVDRTRPLCFLLLVLFKHQRWNYTSTRWASVQQSVFEARLWCG